MKRVLLVIWLYSGFRSFHFRLNKKRQTFLIIWIEVTDNWTFRIGNQGIENDIGTDIFDSDKRSPNTWSFNLNGLVPLWLHSIEPTWEKTLVKVKLKRQHGRPVYREIKRIGLFKFKTLYTNREEWRLLRYIQWPISYFFCEIFAHLNLLEGDRLAGEYVTGWIELNVWAFSDKFQRRSIGGLFFLEFYWRKGVCLNLAWFEMLDKDAPVLDAKLGVGSLVYQLSEWYFRMILGWHV